MINILLSTLFNSGSMSGVGVRRSVEIQCNTEIDHREVKNDRKGIKDMGFLHGCKDCKEEEVSEIVNNTIYKLF